MAAIRMKPGESFDPQAFFEHCQSEIARGKDAKWLPDFVRVVDEFEWTETLKIKVRVLKGVFYHPDFASRVYFRRRGDESYRELTRDHFESLRREFEASGRAHLLEPRA